MKGSALIGFEFLSLHYRDQSQWRICKCYLHPVTLRTPARADEMTTASNAKPIKLVRFTQSLAQDDHPLRTEHHPFAKKETEKLTPFCSFKILIFLLFFFFKADLYLCKSKATTLKFYRSFSSLLGRLLCCVVVLVFFLFCFPVHSARFNTKSPQ